MEILQFWVREALSNFWRNRLMSVLAISTVTLSLFVLGAFAISLANLRSMVAKEAQKLELVVLLDKNIMPERRRQIFDAVRVMPQVKKLDITLASAVLKQYGREMRMPVEDLLSDNPLRDELTVQLRDPNDFFKVRDYLTSIKGVQGLQNVGADDDTRKLLDLNRFLSVTAVVALAVLGLAILLIINNSIRLTLYARRREVHLMQLVGATIGFVRAPFLLEGVLYGMFGAIVAAAGLLVSYSAALGGQTSIIRQMLPLSTGQLFVPCVVGLMAAGCLFGLLGAWLSFHQSRERMTE